MLNWLIELFNAFADVVLSVLPSSPFLPVINYLEGLRFLNYLNWLVPVGDMLTVMTYWLSCIAIFYCFSIVLRWVKLVGE